MDLIAASDGILELISRFFGLTVLDVQTACWTIFVGIVCNVSCAVLGCFLVLRRMSLLGDAISHAILPGLAIAFLISGTLSGIPMFLGALSFGLLTAFLTQALSRYGGVSEDAEAVHSFQERESRSITELLPAEKFAKLESRLADSGREPICFPTSN